MSSTAEAGCVDRSAADLTSMPGRTGDDPELQALRDEVGRLRLALALSREREEHVRHLASHDEMTGLPNRRDFESRSLRAMARHHADGHEFGLMFIDLDGFKLINDQYGHDIGDGLLKVIGSRLRHAMRLGDSVSRHGGDEFVCLVRDVANEARAAAIARKLHSTVSAPCQVGPLMVSVSPSIGIALCPHDATTVAALLSKADHAMRWAKQERLGLAFCGHRPGTPRGAGRAGPTSHSRMHFLSAANQPDLRPRA